MSADCDLLTGGERLNAMRRRAAAEGRPLHGTLALTHRCNFRCVHCYMQPGARPPERELSTAEWLVLAGEAAEAGCFSILLTGGEPLLRADFAEIYLGIRKLGIHVMLFTNASLVDDSIIRTLQAAPPRLIEVSVYGASADTYQRVTGRAENYGHTLRGIALLRQAGLPVRLKTVLMQPNRHDFLAIRALAADGEPPVRYDAMLQSRYHGDEAIKALRIPPEEVVELEARAIPELPAQWAAQQARREQWTPPAGNPLYTCAAGVVSFYVTAAGRVQPCVSAERYGVPWTPGGLLEAFRACRASVRAVRAPPGHPCAACRVFVLCGNCPPIAELECGDEGGVCSYACRLAHERGKRMKNKWRGGHHSDFAMSEPTPYTMQQKVNP